jgi:hypothetical protein
VAALEARNKIRVGGGRGTPAPEKKRLPGLEGRPGQRRTGEGGGSLWAGRRGGRVSAAGCGRWCQAVRPAVAAGAERVSRGRRFSSSTSPAGGGAALSPFFVLSSSSPGLLLPL